jgi:hypothetical protein
MFFDICFMFLKSLSPRYLNEEQQQQIARQLERHILTTLERLQQQRGRPHPVLDLYEGKGHVWDSPCTKFLYFKYAPPNMHPFSSTIQNLVASGMLLHLLGRGLCHHCAQMNKRVHVPGLSKLSTYQFTPFLFLCMSHTVAIWVGDGLVMGQNV